MQKIALLSLLFSFGALEQSFACAPVRPQDYLVFSRGDLHYEKSDFQGLAGAQGNFFFQNFEIGPRVAGDCPRLVTGGDAELISGHVSGAIETGGRLSLRKVSVSGRASALGGMRVSESSVRGRTKASVNVNGLSSAGQFFLDQSAHFAGLDSTTEATLAAQVLDIVASSSGLTVVNVQADVWQSANVIRFSGSPASVVVVNIFGENVSIDRQDVQLVGLPLGHVLLNFPQALTLTITASGAAVTGIPATILAPLAAVTFWNGLITGGLYTGSLCGSGQVNAAFFTGWFSDRATAMPVPALVCPPEAKRCPTR